MRSLLGLLLFGAGTLLNCATAFCASLYLFAMVIWMHAAVLVAIPVTLLMTAPFLAIGWLLRHAGRKLNPKLGPRPWYRTDANGKMVRDGHPDHLPAGRKD